MAMTAKIKDMRPTAFLPDGAADYMKRRAVEGAGIVMIAIGILMLAALLSFDAMDPSINHATDRPARNFLGEGGALLSDLMLQWIGLIALLPAFFIGAWGWRLVADRRLPGYLFRVAAAPPTVLLACLAAAFVPVPGSWPLAVGLGGFLGDSLGAALLGMIPDSWVAAGLGIEAVAGVAVVSALILFLLTLGITWREWRAMGGGIVTGYRNLKTLPNRFGALSKSLRKKVTPPEGPAQEAVEPRLARAVMREAPPREKQQPRPVREDRVEAPSETKPSKRAVKERQIALDLPAQDGEYHLPPLDILNDRQPDRDAQSQNADGLEQNARLLEGVLEDFGVKGEIVKVRPGPVVTLYELEPAPGTKTSRVIGLADDIARSMSAVSVRIATVPGRSVIGIELPNAKREMVGLREILSSSAYDSSKAKLPLVLGKDIGGAPEVVDLATMPHLLIAGTTGSGKSVGLNGMILSLLYKLTPDQCRFIMIDPKMLELSVYDDIPHLLSPVVTDPKKAVVALKWTVREMEDRYRAMSKLSVRNIEGYNKRVTDAARKGEVITRRVQTGFDTETGKPIFEEEPLDLTPLPYIVIVVDEMADLMLVAGKDIEASIQRLAQMARAAGIHVILATQRPSVDVITGTIKANFPTRISFAVTSKVDSRTILGEQGAEQLLGRGDMLHMAGGGRINRVHGPFVDDPEVEVVCEYLKSQGQPDYVNSVTDEEDMSGGFDTDVSGASSFAEGGGGGNEGEELYDKAVALVAREGKCSTSFVQRHLQIGYNRAARIVEQMEKEGVVSQANHVGKREVLVGDHSH